MGISLVKQTRQLLRSENYEWSIKSTSAFSTTLLDRRSGLEGERFTIDYGLLEKEWPLYVLRRKQERYLVGVYDVMQEREEAICTSSREVGVVVELIPYRLSDLGVLSFAEGMYVLRCVLEGYRTLTAHGVGYYLLDEAAICFTRTGTCKFWINENLHLARPNATRLLSEEAFLTALLEAVELRLSHLPQKYLAMREKVDPLTCAGVLAVVDRFGDPRLRAMSSLNGLQSLFSPQSTKYHHSYDKSARPHADQKVSVSKYRRGQRRRREEGMGRRETLQWRDSASKMSISFSKSHRQQVDARLAGRQTLEQLFVSPHKQGTVSPSLILSAYSSRQQSRIRSTCLPLPLPLPSLPIL